MTTPEQWNHRWFGFWSEEGAEYSGCPSARTWPTSNLEPELVQRAAGRLKDAHVVLVSMVTGGRCCAICGVRMPNSWTWRSNGRWLWPDDLEHHLLEHAVQLPDALLRDLQNDPVSAADFDFESLEYP